MDRDKQRDEQTAFTSVGIPTGEEGVAMTDGISEVVEAIMDQIEEDATGEVDSKKIAQSGKTP